MSETRFFHLAYYGYERTVIDSQLVTPALRLAKEGIDIQLLFLENLSGWYTADWNRKKDRLTSFGLTSDFLARMPRNFLSLNTRFIEQFLKPHLKAGPVVVHARGIQGAHAMLPLRRRYPNLRLICDVRGIESAEYVLDLEYRTGQPANSFQQRWARRLAEMESEAVQGSDAVLCVSRSMIPRFRALGGSTKAEFDYVPCAVDGASFVPARAQRDAMRAKLGLEGKLVFVYAGSLSAWQIPKVMLRVVRTALALFPEAAFLAVTTEPARLKAIAAEMGVPLDRVRAVRAPHSEVASYLAAGDVGLLLREQNDVNKYACPTKFAEYLACGLHVLATTAVDEVAASIGRTGAGTLIDSLDNESAVESAVRAAALAARDAQRAVRSEAAATEFDWSVHLATLKKWYLRLASMPPL